MKKMKMKRGSMSLKEKCMILILLVLLSIFGVFNAFSQIQIMKEKSIEPIELAVCKNIVQKYCAAWKAKQYDAMYAMLDSLGRSAIDNEKFVDLYGAGADGRGKVLQFSLKKTAKSQDGIIVQVEMKFKKEKAPVLVNGVYNVHLVSSDNGTWGIKTVVAPIRVPLPGGESDEDHPGE
jgi:hypothetical protein